MLDVTTSKGKRTGQLYLDVIYHPLGTAGSSGQSSPTRPPRRSPSGKGFGCCGSRPQEASKTSRDESTLRRSRSQEVQYKEPEHEDPFFDTVHKTVGELYEVVGKGLSDKVALCEKLGEMRLIVLARRELLPLISGMEIDTEATGLGGVYHNKGGLVAKLVINGVSLCFICSHLAAHEGVKHCETRNKNAEEILREA